MKTSWLTIRDLEYLAALDRTRHFGRAAKEAGTSQPTLSAQLKKLEGWLGFPVFERSRLGVRPTDRGVRVLETAHRVLEEASRILSLSEESQTPLSGKLRLGVIASLGPYLVPHFLAPLKKRYPKLKLQLVEGLTDHLLEDLRTGRLDAVLAARTFDEKGFSVTPLFFEPFVVMAPRSHEFSRRKSVQRSELDAADMILLEDGHCLADQTVELCPPRKRAAESEFHATSLETLKQLVALDAGYTLIPLLAARDEEGYRDVARYVPLAEESAGRSIALVARKESGREADLAALAEAVRGAVRGFGRLGRRISAQ